MKMFASLVAAILIGLAVFFSVQRHEAQTSDNRKAIEQLDKRIELAQSDFTEANNALRSELALPVLPGLGSAGLTNQIQRLQYLNTQNARAKKELDRLKAERAQLK